MIHYQLQCDQQHHFDGWFKDSASFDKQAKLALVECPECGGRNVTRALMAPAVSKRAEVPAPVPSKPVPEKAAVGPIPAAMLAMLQKIRAEVEKNCDYVGEAFAGEVRKMHRGEVELRGVYGEASEEDAETLMDEGIEIARIPWVPRAEG
jgi:hypothetical protein